MDAPSLFSFTAGRSNRREGTKYVDAAPEKGHIEMTVEDGLINWLWVNRSTGDVEEQLVIFPGEATFEKVSQERSGRTVVLKFSSSDKKYFFWYQDLSNEKDARTTADVNALLQDPEYVPGSAPLAAETAALDLSAAGPSGSSAAASSSAIADAPRAEGSGGNSEDMARMLVEWAQAGGLGAGQEDAHLTDVLSSSNVSNLITSHPELASTLKPLLPPGLSLPDNPTPQDLVPILTAPQFTEATASLDNALRSGGLPGSMMTELGLPETAGNGVKEFLEALQALGGKKPDNEDESME